jgi:4-hydroxybenzoate polyprenyltransferase
MRDVEGDAKAGVKTVPVLLGIARTKLLFVAIDLVIGAVVLAISVPLVPWWQSGVLTLGMIYTGLVISPRSSGSILETFSAILLPMDNS